MRSHHGFWIGAALALAACSAGDLSLPGPNQPAALPAALQALSGDGQEAAPGAVLDQPLTVRVVDDSAHPVSGASVHFGFLGDVGGGALDPSSATTDERGRAAAAVRLGAAPGEQTIVAEVANAGGRDLRASFTATAVLPDSAGDGKQGGGSSHGHQGNGSEGD
jgi:hypothetical protein